MTGTTDDTPLPGLTWDTLDALRERAAQYWHRRHGQRIDLDEYYSAGNEALTLAIQRYRPHGTASPQRTVALYLTWHMRHVPRAMAYAGEFTWNTTRTWNHRGTQTVPVDPHARFWDRRLSPSMPPAETRTYAHELLADLRGFVADAPLAGFVLVALEWRWSEVQHLFGHTSGWLNWHLPQIRRLCAQRRAAWAHITPEEVA